MPTVSEAVGALEDGHVVIIGENHTKPDARKFILDLLTRSAGYVAVLMMESFRVKDVDLDSDGGVNAELADTKQNWRVASIQDSTGSPNAVTFRDLIVEANEQKVRPVGCDLEGVWTDPDTKGRDEHMVKIFTRVKEKYPTGGVVMLVGSSHLENLKKLIEAKGTPVTTFKID
jgi:hypothetical protein